MNIIYPDQITSISADKADANYPVTNLQTKHVKQVWKSTDNEGVLTIVAAKGDGVRLFGSNAQEITIKVKTGINMSWGDDGTELEWGDDGVEVEWFAGADEVIVGTYDLLPTGLGHLWADYGERNYSHTIELTLKAAVGAVVEAGKVVVGTKKVFVTPKLRMPEGLKSYSIVRELNIGAIYVKKRDIVRKFNINIRLQRDRKFYEFMHEIFLVNGEDPLAFVLTDLSNFEWTVYAQALIMPSGSHDYPEHSVISASIVEVV